MKSKKPSVRIRKPSKRESLIAAVRSGDSLAVRRLVQEGADPNVKDAKGRNALWHAAWWAQAEVVRDLVHGGVTLPDDVLMGPVQVANEKLVRFLVRHGANVDCVASYARFSNKFPRKRVLLTVAIERAKTTPAGEKIAIMLINAGAKLNRMAYPKPEYQDFNWPLIGRAAHGGLLRTVKAMIRRGADVNMRDTWGGSALLDALVQGHVKIAETLLAAGADVNIVRRDGVTPLSAARDAGLTEFTAKLTR